MWRKSLAWHLAQPCCVSTRPLTASGHNALSPSIRGRRRLAPGLASPQRAQSVSGAFDAECSRTRIRDQVELTLQATTQPREPPVSSE